MAICVNHIELSKFARTVLIATGLSVEHANIVADHLVTANLRGIDSHGVMRLPAYIDAIEKRIINPRPHVKVVKEGEGFALVDGDRGLGHIATYQATQIAAIKAKKMGVAIAATRNHWHSGMLAYYIMKLVSNGFVGIIMANSSPRMSLPGFRSAIVGTNPIAIGVPGPEFPIIFDAAMSVVAFGKIVEAAKKGMPIPPGWALDSEGKVTTDPRKARYVLPIGGYKGLGIAVMIDILCSMLAGARYGLQMEPSLYSQGGTIVIAINIDAFRPLRFFVEELAEYISKIKSIQGEYELLLPGEPEYKTYITRASQGIPIPEAIYSELKKLALKYGVEMVSGKTC